MMLWNLVIDENSDEKLTTTITIIAENWYSALQDGLERFGVDGKVLSNLSCDVSAGGRVMVTDSVTKKVYTLAPVETRDDGEDTDEPPPHTVFFLRDEAPEDGSGIYYRERLIAVDAAVSKETASDLALHYYEQLRSLKTQDDTKRFITVQVYDHAFEKRAARPAVAALTWREWRPDGPRIIYPLSGEEGVTFSKAAAEKGTDTEAASAEAATPNGAYDVSDRMVTAFERMQEIYTVRDHDQAAAVVLTLARELIPSDIGSCMLMSPGKYELYVAATEGPAAEVLKEQPLSLQRGILGFTARNSVVAVVTDPKNDDRFDEDFDNLADYQINTLIVAPVQYEGQLVGILELFNSAKDGGFNTNDANILSYIGTSFAEYVCTSLPSREADFTNKEFTALEMRRRAKMRMKTKATRAASKKTDSKKTASKRASTKKSASKKDGPARTERDRSARKTPPKKQRTDAKKKTSGSR